MAVTRTRKASSTKTTSKAKASKAGTKKSPAKKTTAKKPAAKKGPSAAEKAAAKKARAEAAAQRKAEREQAKAAEREQAILDGELIEGKDGIEYHRVEPTTGTMIDRANALLEEIKASDVPIATRDLIAKRGGQFPQYLAMFSLLEAQGEVVKFRQRGGKQGAAQVAFLHVSKLG